MATTPRDSHMGPAGIRRNFSQDQDEILSTSHTPIAKDPVLIPGRSFTIRGVVVGLAVGLVICFSNMYFGLQTGWVSTMTMPASLMGFAFFKSVSRHLDFPFSPVENVLVQTVAGSMAIMPLGCGFVGVVPAMNYLMAPGEQGPLTLSLWKLIIWSLGLCYFGVVFAVPLRRQVIIREKLRFPSGFSTAVLISVLHGQARQASSDHVPSTAADQFASLASEPGPQLTAVTDVSPTTNSLNSEPESLQEPGVRRNQRQEWATNMRLLVWCFCISGLYTLCTYFLPGLRDIPIFGSVARTMWLWSFNPSPAYIGQGIIMGPETTLHMALGAVIGWGVLSPLAKYKGWAPGPIDDWEHGSKGWIVWVSLAIMLADSIVSLGSIMLRPLWQLRCIDYVQSIWKRLLIIFPADVMSSPTARGYSAIPSDDSTASPGLLSASTNPAGTQVSEPPRGYQTSGSEADAPNAQLVGNKTVAVGLFFSVVLCVMTTRIVFGAMVPLYATVIAVLMALLLSIMGVRALGETDLNPVSGISKLAQLFFALIIPQTHKSSVLINLVAGAVSEAGALQAGDLMQDLKTGHLLGAAPNAQFWGQVIGSTVGAVVSALVYQLYTTVYQVPGDLFQVPTAYVWVFTARLVTGRGLPNMAKEWAVGFGAVFAITTWIRAVTIGKPWRNAIPGGIAVAVGMYNVPSFTIARTVGGLVSWYWLSRQKRSSTPLIVIASGFILGEGFFSILNLVLQSLSVPHYKFV